MKKYFLFSLLFLLPNDVFAFMPIPSLTPGKIEIQEQSNMTHLIPSHLEKWNDVAKQNKNVLQNSNLNKKNIQKIPSSKNIPSPNNEPKTYSRFQELTLPINPTLYLEDESILKFVWPKTPFNNVKYTPSELISVSSEFVQWNGLLRPEASDALSVMGRDFYMDFQRPIRIVSAYRNYDHQLSIAKNRPQCVTNNLCAKPGYSEHQTWLTVDVFGLSNKTFGKSWYSSYYDWFQENAHKYGFTQSYQNGKAIDGYQRENWHWRYVGEDMARKLQELGWTYTQFIEYQKKNAQL